MHWTTNTLAEYLGNPSSDILFDPPFRTWTFERTDEEGLDEAMIDYVASEGLSFSCDETERVSVIFLYSDALKRAHIDLEDIPFESSRSLVRMRLGVPTKSGMKVDDPVLGQYGDWDLFSTQEYSVHVEYRRDVDAIKRVTLMRADVVP